MIYKYMLIQTAVGDYRQGVLNKLYELGGCDFTVACGDVYFDGTTLTRVNFVGRRINLINYFFFGRRFAFQVGAFWHSVMCQSVVLEMNPRILNSWLIPLFRKILGKRTVLWGHAWPRSGRYAKSDIVRNCLRNLADEILVYTETQASELRERMPKMKITPAPNSLYSRDQMVSVSGTRANYLYVGRLVKEKKPDLMINAFSRLVAECPDFSGKLVIVGDGPYRAYCESMVAAEGLLGRVEFKGHISDVAVLKELYADSLFSISPGYVGLSITQSFSFGIPMIIASDENHSPEIEAAKDGVNALFFSKDDPLDLQRMMQKAYYEKNVWISRSEEIVDYCKASYSVEYMASQIWKALSNA